MNKPSEYEDCFLIETNIGNLKKTERLYTVSFYKNWSFKLEPITIELNPKLQ